MEKNHKEPVKKMIELILLSKKKFSIIDAGCGSAAHRSVENIPCVTIALDIKFIAPTKEGDEILGTVTISKKTKSMIFVVCNLECDGRLTASASGVWKILRNKSFPK